MALEGVVGWAIAGSRVYLLAEARLVIEELADKHRLC